jgi:hypothetical protein
MDARDSVEPAATYHQQRLDRTLNGNGWLDPVDTPGLLLHVIPTETFSSEGYYRFELNGIEYESLSVLSNPFGHSRSRGSHFRTETGIGKSLSSQSPDIDDISRYVHLSSAGVLEAAIGSMANESGRYEDAYQMSASSFEAKLVSGINEYCTILATEGGFETFEVHLSLFEVEDVVFVYENTHREPFSPPQFKSNTVAPFPTIVSQVDSDREARAELKPLFEAIWRAADRDSPPTISDSGEWELGGEY